VPRCVTVATAVAGMTVGGLLAIGAGAAAATDLDVKWDEAAAGVQFTVYRPARTIGLRTSVRTRFCDGNPGHRFLTASYSKPGSTKGPRITAWEDTPYPCGNAGESQAVKTVRIDGAKVRVSVFCPISGERCTVEDGFENGFLLYLRKPGPKRTVIQLTARHVSLKALVRVARSFRRVDLTRPRTIRVNSFLSPDRHTWCAIHKDVVVDGAWCVTQPAWPNHFPEHSGEVHRDGTVTFCHGTNVNDLCTQNWDTGAPILRVGQRSELYGYECASEANGITCTAATGPGRGKGFRIDNHDVYPVG
jgi:hypothetical protein